LVVEPFGNNEKRSEKPAEIVPPQVEKTPSEADILIPPPEKKRGFTLFGKKGINI
jgi:hypothetical protein